MRDAAQSVSEPIQTDTEDTERPQRVREQLAVVDTSFLPVTTTTTSSTSQHYRHVGTQWLKYKFGAQEL